jgi:hypothetical protein
MQKLSFVVFFLLTCKILCSQEVNIYQKGLTAQQNLDAIGSLAPYSTGGIGFDTRYEGVKGTPRLFDTLCPSYLKIKGQDYYLQLKTDIDLVRNTLLFLHPKTGQLISLPANMVLEVVINNKDKEMIFRTTEGKNFEKDLKELRFYQVLKEEPNQFIKMPVKIFTEANYKGAYSADRRYDEFETKYRYYIYCSDNSFHQVQLNRKSLVKLFPDKKDLIENTIKSKTYASDEEMVLSVLEALQ